MTTETRPYYLLAIFNHERGRFNFRIEQEQGLPGELTSKHTLTAYLVAMTRELHKKALDPTKPDHWRFDLYRDILSDSRSLVQVTLACLPAVNKAQATSYLWHFRKDLRRTYKELGYEPFGAAEAPEADADTDD